MQNGEVIGVAAANLPALTNTNTLHTLSHLLELVYKLCQIRVTSHGQRRPIEVYECTSVTRVQNRITHEETS